MNKMPCTKKSISSREQVFDILRGKRPQRMPFVPDISDWYAARRTPKGEPLRHGSGKFIADDDPIHKNPGDMPKIYRDFTYLDFYRHFGWGLHVHIHDWYRIHYTGGVVQKIIEEGGIRTIVYSTPKGEIDRNYILASDGTWCPRIHLVKRPEDLEILRYIVENTEFEQNYSKVQEKRDVYENMGQGDIVLGRSPFGKLVQEYMGFEKVIYALADAPETIESFMRLQTKKDLELVRLAADVPEDIAIISDHADENLIAPVYWRRYCIPFYREAVLILHRAGKFVSTHLDGNFKGFFPYLAESTFDLLDGCTPAPMFNYEVEELANALPPNMYAFCGVPATFFSQEAVQIKEIIEFAARIRNSLKGRGILNVGDILSPSGDIEKVIALGEWALSSN